MHLSHLDEVLWVASALGQASLLTILLFRRIYRLFPILTAFIAYSIASDPLLLLASTHVSAENYFRLFLVDSFAQNLFQLGILFEVATSVLRPVQRSLPKSSVIVFALMLFGGTLITFLLSARSNPQQLRLLGDWFLRISFFSAILRLVIFSAITFFSQMLGINWRNHVLQLATGFAFYAGVTLVIEMAHRFLGVKNFHALEQTRIAAWIFTIGYWSYCLLRQEAPRKEFSPQMANFLVSISGVARRNKAAVLRLNNK